ncbi:hypothetical protein CAPTEDRAFT_217181 [Capitella teleta]|uniref:Uncharacterized protein n=1 Tax=Capitella teleta TaxID=283909 RepID=R7V1S6_CAPTE|nr:hypothetical protein CAPTEDRAFT_217181 [Capitella teleta]|eukprot:ELU12798.1 hypothetical protein CAPTEDRAFT_217181 [Capitella teleta]
MVGGTVNKDTHRYIIQRMSNSVEMLCDWNLIRGSCCILGVLEKSLLSVLVCVEFGLSAIKLSEIVRLSAADSQIASMAANLVVFLQDVSNSTIISTTLTGRSGYHLQEVSSTLYTWCPPNDPQSEVSLFIEKCKQDIGDLSSLQPLRSHTISREERITLNTLRNRKDIVIKPANKGGAVVVWRKHLYIAEVEE